MTNDITANLEGEHIRVEFDPRAPRQGEEWTLQRSLDGTIWTQLNYPRRIPAGTRSTVDENPPEDTWFQYRVCTGEAQHCAVITCWLRTIRDDTGGLILEYRPIDFGGMIAGLRRHAGL